MTEVVRGDDHVVELVVERHVDVPARRGDHEDWFVHVGESAVHRDRRTPCIAAVVGREQLHARVELVQERHVDRPAAAPRVVVAVVRHPDLGVVLPSDRLAGGRADEGLRTEGPPAVGGAPEQDAGAGAVALAGGRVDAGDQLVHPVRVVRVDRNRGLPVALVLRVDVVPGGALVVEAGGAGGRCGGSDDRQGSRERCQSQSSGTQPRPLSSSGHSGRRNLSASAFEKQKALPKEGSLVVVTGVAGAKFETRAFGL